MIDVAYGNDFRPTTSHTVATTLNKVLASHAVKGGMEMRIYREDSLSTANAQSGQYAFTNAYTRQNSASGTDYQGLQNYASFLLGMPSTTSILRASDYSEYSKTWGFFVQDDWRVNSKLTLNLGLRYEVETALTERNDKSVSGFDYGYVQPIEGTVQAKYAALNDPALKALVPQLNVRGGLMFAGVDGSSRLYETPKDTFLPRVGFAYQLNPKTVLRGGVGLFAGFLGQRRGDVYPERLVADDHHRPPRRTPIGAPIPQELGQRAARARRSSSPSATRTAAQQGLGQAIDFFNQNPKVSKQLRYQIGFQRELPGGFVVEAAYVGNYGYDIEIVQNINALPNEYLNGDNSRTAGDERQQRVPDRLGREPVRGAAARARASTTRRSRARSCCGRTRSSATSAPRTTTASPGTTRRRSACRSASRRATRSASPTPTRTGCRRPST